MELTITRSNSYKKKRLSDIYEINIFATAISLCLRKNKPAMIKKKQVIYLLMSVCAFQVWTDAAALTFFSVSTGIGGIFTIASYSNFNNNIFMDSVVVSVIADGRKNILCVFLLFFLYSRVSILITNPTV